MGAAGDSAGVPWAGRTLQPHGFADDDGRPEPALRAALARWAELTGGPGAAPGPGPDRWARSRAEHDVVAALEGTRVFAPVVAALDEAVETAHGAADKSADMALALLTRPDSSRALPLFTGLDALQAWDPRARPVPVAIATAALAGAQEKCDVLVLDPAGPVPFVVRRAAFWSLARSRPWLPSPLDEEVSAAVRTALDGLPPVRGVRCEPGTDAELRVVLGVAPGLDQVGLTALSQTVGERLAADATVTERVESLELRVLPAP